MKSQMKPFFLGLFCFLLAPALVYAPHSPRSRAYDELVKLMESKDRTVKQKAKDYHKAYHRVEYALIWGKNLTDEKMEKYKDRLFNQSLFVSGSSFGRDLVNSLLEKPLSKPGKKEEGNAMKIKNGGWSR